MDLFVDFQGFKNGSNEFIVKEFAVATSDGTIIQHWTVRSPCPYAVLDVKTKKQCTWTTNHYHGIRWQDGDVTIQALHRQLFPILNSSVVYVKGLEKANYIKEFFSSCLVIDLEDYPSLKNLTTSNVYCFFHGKSKMMCALNNVLKLVQYHNQ